MALARHERARFDMRTYLFKLSGLDLTRINSTDATTALKVISEVETVLSGFPSSNYFTSWLGLCPGTKITNGKRMSSKSKRTPLC